MATPDFQAQVQENFKHNFTVNVLDGIFFWFGSSFYATRTIAPLFLSYLTDNTFVFGILSMIVSTGWLLPQLFTANWVQGTARKKDIPVKLGFFTERVPIFLLVAAAWVVLKSESIAITFFLILIGWHVIGAGVVAVGWQDLIARVVPVKWRGRFFGLSNALGNGTGILGASLAAWLLERFGFPYNFMIAFGIGAVFMFLSWLFLAQTREPVPASVPARQSNTSYWRSLPAIIKQDRNYRRFLYSQMLTALGGMALGFLTVYAIRRWQVEDSTVSLFTTSLLAGTAASNLLLGGLADRYGHKLVMELSTAFNALSILTALFAPAPAWFYLVFALQGASNAGFIISGISIVFEFSEEEIRPTYIGLTNSTIGIFAAIAPLIGGLLIDGLGFAWLFSVAVFFLVAGMFLLHFSVEEPRTPAVTPAAFEHPPHEG